MIVRILKIPFLLMIGYLGIVLAGIYSIGVILRLYGK